MFYLTLKLTDDLDTIFVVVFFLYHIMQYNNAHVTKEALKPYSSTPNVKLDGTRTR